MKQHPFSYLFLFFFSLLGISFFSSPALGAQTSVWKLKTDHNTLYLCGSVHLLSKKDHPLPQPFEDAYKDSQKLVFEILTDEMESKESQLKLMKAGVFPDGKKISSVLSKETYALYQDRMKKAGLPPLMTDRMRPWMAAVTLSLTEMQRMGAMPQYGVDFHFDRQAKTDRKERGALETVDFQISIFSSLSDEEGEEFLKQTLDHLDKTTSVFSQMVNAWRSGNSKELEKLLLDSFEAYPDIADRFLYARNKKWIPQIEELIKEKKNTMIIVGAGHLIGDQGVVALLRQKGYHIEQMKYRPSTSSSKTPKTPSSTKTKTSKPVATP